MFLQKVEGFKVIKIEARVTNCPTTPEMARAIDECAARVADAFEIPDINKRPAIAATRAAYKALGKDPNRYRPSAEALCRRAVKGVEIYRISNLVDLINVLSLQTGYSIGGFDLDKIEGDALTLGRGREGEEFEGIGRGPLNIDGLPVYRDSVGGIGTPTSDHERTKLDLDTKRILMTINVYGESEPLQKTIETATDLLRRFGQATDLSVDIVEEN